MYRFKFGDRVVHPTCGKGTVVEKDAQRYTMFWVHFYNPQKNNTPALDTGTGYPCTAMGHRWLKLLVREVLGEPE